MSSQIWIGVSQETPLSKRDGSPWRLRHAIAPILAYVAHKGVEYFADGRLTIYGAHAEDHGWAVDGIHIIEWGGEDASMEDNLFIPDWWFVHHSNFEVVAAPICWLGINV